MTRRRAFTLIEVMVALVVTSLVVSLAYAALRAGLDTGARVGAHRDGSEAAVSIRALASDALRHSVEGIRGGADVFQLSDRVGADGTPSDSLRFVSRGVEPPFGSSAPWLVTLWHSDDRVSLLAVPVDAARGVQPIRASLRGVRGLDVQALGRSSIASWSPTWSEPSIAPEAVRLAIPGGDGESLGIPLVVRTGLERTP
jgi:prepilin-type N-terminal cleavage/methylation domain-containing protein